MHLQDFDTAHFLREHWQREPLLIRNPWAAWHNPIDPDELAGLACEPEVESRLVVQAGNDWAVEHGPIEEDRFGRLDDRPCSLLVQAVDHHVPEVAALLDQFRFIPNWRIEDVMVSYAADGGGVGAHYDQYDVFLIQGLGRRRWRIGAPCDQGSPLLPHDDLRLLAHFEPTREWILDPGDILYLPPRVPHEGVALGDDCMTYSIGFRAPSRGELTAHWCDAVLAGTADDDRYTDPAIPPQANPGEITPPALAALHAMATDAMRDSALFARWFGQYTSARKYPEVDWRPEEPADIETVRAALGAGLPLRRNAASRFCFIRQDTGGLLLFVDGQCFTCEGAAVALAEMLCAQDCFRIGPETGHAPGVTALIAALCNLGSVAFDEAY